ncbi:hypothetical protein O181_119485 [Austropuccinia psidii MF-1]|uniref:Uncharacterized protein n=1 Tax=Austropuccinia psidii MF-1 TaxID=1389203 RepID=A0A9Q3Q0E3_9BASI|nr:hypothetical protein [Austropuccinia psidii MF-1]
MIPPHCRVLVFPRDQPLQRPSVIRRGKEVKVYQSHKICKNEPFSTFQISLQQKSLRRGLHRLRPLHYHPPTPQIPVPMEHPRNEIQTRIPLARTRRKLPENFCQRDILLTTHGNHKKVKSRQEAQNPGGKGRQDQR